MKSYGSGARSVMRSPSYGPVPRRDLGGKPDSEDHATQAAMAAGRASPEAATRWSQSGRLGHGAPGDGATLVAAISRSGADPCRRHGACGGTITLQKGHSEVVLITRGSGV